MSTNQELENKKSLFYSFLKLYKSKSFLLKPNEEDNTISNQKTLFSSQELNSINSYSYLIDKFHDFHPLAYLEDKDEAKFTLIKQDNLFLNLFVSCYKLAEKYHGSQKDKNNDPYFNHLSRVSKLSRLNSLTYLSLFYKDKKNHFKNEEELQFVLNHLLKKHNKIYHENDLINRTYFYFYSDESLLSKEEKETFSSVFNNLTLAKSSFLRDIFICEISGLLHDLIEDTEITLEQLSYFLTTHIALNKEHLYLIEDIINTVDLLTKYSEVLKFSNQESFEQFIQLPDYFLDKKDLSYKEYLITIQEMKKEENYSLFLDFLSSSKKKNKLKEALKNEYIQSMMVDLKFKPNIHHFACLVKISDIMDNVSLNRANVIPLNIGTQSGRDKLLKTEKYLNTAKELNQFLENELKITQ